MQKGQTEQYRNGVVPIITFLLQLQHQLPSVPCSKISLKGTEVQVKASDVIAT